VKGFLGFSRRIVRLFSVASRTYGIAAGDTIVTLGVNLSVLGVALLALWQTARRVSLSRSPPKEDGSNEKTLGNHDWNPDVG
jgi:hypothetical protein